MLYVAEDYNKKIVGYVLAKIVSRTHRKLGLATKLMTAARECSEAARECREAARECSEAARECSEAARECSEAARECAPYQAGLSHLFPLSCLIPYSHTPSPHSCPAGHAMEEAFEHAMEEVFGAEYVSLHVRKSNRAAFHLYTETLGYKINDIEAKYYADSEDAYDMRKNLKPAAEKPKKELKGGKAASDDKASSNNEDVAKEDAEAASNGDRGGAEGTGRADESKAGEKKEEGSEKAGEKEVAAPATPVREKEKGASPGVARAGLGGGARAARANEHCYCRLDCNAMREMESRVRSGFAGNTGEGER
ncbi:unnamed protein product [Closterium sp. Naga37s-1]|nr:unnamed protein product [Closterium sp. Naga37s-1]